MKLEDVRDYLTLRRVTENPWEVVRFRKRQAEGRALSVQFRGRPAIHVRGGRADYHIFHRIFLRDEYRLDPILRSDMTILDLGGNVGLFSARVAPDVARVVVYEPMPENFAQLTENTRNLANVTAVQSAVGGEAGDLELFMPANEKTSGVFSAHPTGNELLTERSVTVPCVTLDDVFREHHIDRCDLLKIDVEGAEYDIFEAASDETWNKIQRIHGEYHDVVPHTERNRIEGFEAWLNERGFTVDVLRHRRKPNHGMFFATR